MKSARIAAVLAAVAGLCLAPVRAGGAAPIDMGAVRAAAQASVCRVSVNNSWGVPVATASGFLIGDGRFVVTDLGAVARPSVERVQLTFADGSAARAVQFGMADAALGLVVLRVEGDASPRKGLPLAAALPPLDGTASVAAAGWQWGSQLDVVTGRLCKGPTIREVAALTRVDTPPGVDAFVRIDGGRTACAGAPVFDSAGTVVAVTLEVTVHNTSAALAMPASSLRSALLVAQPQLKPLADLPKPLWPSRLLRLAGKPAWAGDCASAVSTFKMAMTCPTCKGRGKVQGPSSSMWSYSMYSYVPCPRCHAETCWAQASVVKALAPAVEGATRTFWAPVADDNSRTAARATGAEVIKSLATAGRHYQFGHARLQANDLISGPLPQGVLVHAEVQKKIDGPDGRYVVLAPRNGSMPVLVRVDDLVAPGAKSTVTARKEPADGTWIFLAGTAIARLPGPDPKGVFILPLEWTPATMPIDP
ncbi:MAG: trypsin-like peptidase domain-containing protein [Planctomycetota bacterium]|nr:trypsin-like peptidase domain-containing protein [Planctomycetota bacterium]